MRKKTLTIGIPAYNEEANIKYLLQSLFTQNTKSFRLESVIVASDKSTDDTIAEAQKIKNRKIKILTNTKRLGQAATQRKIFQGAYSDIVVLLNADILIKDKNFLEKLINPILKEKADLTSVSVREISAETNFEKILKLSMDFKRSIFENYKEGANIYTCHGRARAFSKKLYKSLDFKNSIGEDAYSYLYAISNNFKYQFVKDTEVFYKLPNNIADHEKQSIRFYQSSKELKRRFSKVLVDKEYTFPKLETSIAAAKYIIKNPNIIIYFALTTFLRLKSRIVKINDLWDTSTTSKRIINDNLSISVIIPTCYGGDSLVTAVKSIRESDPKNQTKIIIVADTVPISKGTKNKLSKLKAKLIENKVRSGQFKKIKQGLSLVSSDIVMFAQDDVVFEKQALNKIVQSFSKNEAVTMISINDTPFSAKNIIEAGVNVGYRISHRIRKSWNSGQNYMLACGRALSFRTNAVKKFIIPDNLVNGDAYLYFENKRLKGQFAFENNAVVYYKSPSDLSDYLKKSSRYQENSAELITHFGKKIINELNIPTILVLKSLLMELVTNPIPFMAYVPLVAYTRIFKLSQKENLNALWKAELSTKS